MLLFSSSLSSYYQSVWHFVILCPVQACCCAAALWSETRPVEETAVRRQDNRVLQDAGAREAGTPEG
jgi:hypothetical protein